MFRRKWRLIEMTTGRKEVTSNARSTLKKERKRWVKEDIFYIFFKCCSSSFFNYFLTQILKICLYNSILFAKILNKPEKENYVTRKNKGHYEGYQTTRFLNNAN